jgi:hypothetical protein
VAVSFSRSSRIRSTVSVGVVVGTLWGRRERDSKAVSPSAL